MQEHKVSEDNRLTSEENLLLQKMLHASGRMRNLVIFAIFLFVVAAVCVFAGGLRKSLNPLEGGGAFSALCGTMSLLFAAIEECDNKELEQSKGYQKILTKADRQLVENGSTELLAGHRYKTLKMIRDVLQADNVRQEEDSDDKIGFRQSSSS